MVKNKIKTPKALKTTFVKAVGVVATTPKGPDEKLDKLFREVQKRQLFGDGKTFVDLVPRRSSPTILKAYDAERKSPDFDLKDFVGRNFYNLEKPSRERPTDETLSASEHISELWTDLMVTID